MAAKTQHAETRGAPRQGRVTISQVAQSLGLTKGTVSRALNNYPDISESTRKRVEKQVARMGYRPLSHAQAIRTGRTRSLGLVLQTNMHDAQRPFLTDFLAGISQEASLHDWSLTVATAHSDSDMQATLERLIAERKADGFILPRTMVEDPRIAQLAGAGVPFVLYGRAEEERGHARFDILGEDAMHEAVSRLAALGHRRIGFVNGGTHFSYAALRQGGYHAGLKAAGLRRDPALEHADALTPEDGFAATGALLDLALPPTAIIFALDMAALGAYRAAAQRGLAVGRELSVIGYDGVPEGAWANPGLSTFNVDNRRAGARLAHLLIELIRGTPPARLRETQKAAFVARQSHAPCTLTSNDLARLIRDNLKSETETGGK